MWRGNLKFACANGHRKRERLDAEVTAESTGNTPEKPKLPIRIEQLKIVITHGRYKWGYSRTKNGMVRVGELGAHSHDATINVSGRQALTVYIEEIHKAIAAARKRIADGDVPAADNGMEMFKAAGLKA